jgi:hypothetical protein
VADEYQQVMARVAALETVLLDLLARQAEREDQEDERRRIPFMGEDGSGDGFGGEVWILGKQQDGLYNTDPDKRWVWCYGAPTVQAVEMNVGAPIDPTSGLAFEPENVEIYEKAKAPKVIKAWPR